MTSFESALGTSVHEIAEGVFRISTPVTDIPGGFTFNQFLVVDDEPLLFHTGHARMFPSVRAAVAHVLGDVARLRWVGFSHFESDECGALDAWLAACPQATPLCSMVAKNVSIDHVASRPARGLTDGEALAIGAKTLRWLDAPNLPHNWECGYLFESRTRTLLCGDLFTQGGTALPPITEGDILGPSEAARKVFDYMAIGQGTRAALEKLARTEPLTLATMHGSSFRGDGAALLRAQADALGV